MKSFEPIIHIIEDQQSLLVMFDSGWDHDVTRMPRLVRVTLPIQDLSWKMDAEQLPLDESIPSYPISLIVKSSDGESSYALGSITPEKSGGQAHAGAIYQGIANSFSRALLLYLSQKSQPVVPSVEIGQKAGSPVHRGKPQAIGSYDDGRSNRSRPILKSVAQAAAVAVVLVAVTGFFVSIPFMGSNAADPIQTAVAQNMAQDPASITAQVELTKETLRQMGLDPGAAGDLGCLAPR